MEKFEQHFPMEDGLRRVQIDLSSAEPFEEMFESVRERHDSIQRVFDVMNESAIPIHVPAGVLRSDIIETRYGLHQAGKPYRVCQGTAPERGNAFAALRANEKHGCVVDALTLSLVRRLGVEHAVRDVCGSIGVTGSTREVYWRRIEEMKEVGKPSTTLFWKNGYYYRHESTQEEWEQALQVREADLAWIDENATTVPAEGLADAPEELRRLNRAIGDNFIDDMLAAQGYKRLLLCQDQAYRAVAAQYLGLRATWLQPVLMAARDDGLLARVEYDKAILSLIDFGDEMVAIDSEVLVAAMDRQNEDPRRFERVVRLLGGPQAELVSHARVAADFLAHIWSERRWELATSQQTSMVLENLIRGQDQWPIVVWLLRRIFRQRHGREDELDEYMLGWLKGHFLVPFQAKQLPIAHGMKPRS
jgi:hypothetical protein